MPIDQSLEDMKSWYVLKILEYCKQNRTHAAKRLKISLRNLRNILDRLRVEGFQVCDSKYKRKMDKNKTKSHLRGEVEKLLKQNELLTKEIGKLLKQNNQMKEHLSLFKKDS